MLSAPLALLFCYSGAMGLLLFACWRPAAYVPPEPPPQAKEAMEAVGEEAPEKEEGASEVADEERKTEEEEAIEEKPAIQPYAARIITAPATLVDDFGRPVGVIEKAETDVEVRAEEEIRKKVYCGSCNPAVEGWIQKSLVERR